jgi:hypothetical protein
VVLARHHADARGPGFHLSTRLVQAFVGDQALVQELFNAPWVRRLLDR